MLEWEKNISESLEEIVMGVNIDPRSNDKWVRNQERSRIYSVKSVYCYLAALVFNRETDFNSFKLFWSNVLPHKVSIYEWRTILNGLATKENLVARGIPLNGDDMHDGLCKEVNESI